MEPPSLRDVPALFQPSDVPPEPRALLSQMDLSFVRPKRLPPVAAAGLRAPKSSKPRHHPYAAIQRGVRFAASDAVSRSSPAAPAVIERSSSGTTRARSRSPTPSTSAPARPSADEESELSSESSSGDEGESEIESDRAARASSRSGPSGAVIQRPRNSSGGLLPVGRKPPTGYSLEKELKVSSAEYKRIHGIIQSIISNELDHSISYSHQRTQAKTAVHSKILAAVPWLRDNYEDAWPVQAFITSRLKYTVAQHKKGELVPQGPGYVARGRSKSPTTATQGKGVNPLTFARRKEVVNRREHQRR